MSENGTFDFNRIVNIEENISEIKTVLTKNTASLEHHILRTDQLQKIVEPLHAEYVGKQAIEKYKKQVKSDLLYKLKLPGLVVGTLVAIGTLWALFKG